MKDISFSNMTMMLPWLTKLMDDNRELLDEGWWPYGLNANRAALNPIFRYHHEQGLTVRRFEIQDVFVPGLLDT